MLEEHTCGRQNVQPHSEGLSLTLGGKERERERERPWERERSEMKADFAGASVPDSSLNDSHFAAQAWDSQVSLLTDYLFAEDENQCRDFWEGLEASWSSSIEVLHGSHIAWQEQ